MPPNLRHPLESRTAPWPAPPEQPSPPTELISLSRSDSIDSSAPVSDLPSSFDPPSSSGKRALDTQQLHIQQDPPVKKKRLTEKQRIATIADALSTILDCLDDDSQREGLKKTPIRYAKALLALTEGYSKSIEQVIGDAEFHENHSEMVLIRNIDIFSMCEHHLLPFYGTCHVAYIPSGPIIGLSKIARIIDIYAKRFQVQERLTTQIADAVVTATKAAGVMVYVSCTHMCMAMRGIQKVGTQTATTAVRGRYAGEPQLRAEFLSIIHGHHLSSHG